MIRKIGESYKITEVRQERTRYFTMRLKKSEWRTLKVDRDFFTRRTCVNCGMYERPDIYSVQVFPEKLWICDDCAAKFCPELLSEAKRLREEGYERDWGISKEEQEEHRRARSSEGFSFDKYLTAGTPDTEAGTGPPPDK